jgi:hypothetical protein
LVKSIRKVLVGEFNVSSVLYILNIFLDKRKIELYFKEVLKVMFLE